MFTGEFASADAMASAGLVNQVVDDERLLQEVQALVDKIASKKSPLGLRRMKALIDDGLQQPVDTRCALKSLPRGAFAEPRPARGPGGLQ